MKILSDRSLYKGNWLELREKSMINTQGEKTQWEYIARKNIQTAVIIIAQLLPSQRYVLIKQYRAPVDTSVIGFPAGLVDNHEPIDTAALRELKEETGYTGVASQISPCLCASPAMTTEKLYIVHATIDEYHSLNLHPTQQLEAAEEISVVCIKENSILSYLAAEQKKGTLIGARLWTYFNK